MSGVDLLALAAKVEACTGADRELDALIFGAFDPRYEKSKHFGAAAMQIVGNAGLTRSTPTYTASLDAAMTLVPEGWQYCLLNCGGVDQKSPTEGRGTAVLWPVGHISDGKPVEASTPALALVSAALRARHQSAAGEGKDA